jgi:hypothetical protein
LSTAFAAESHDAPSEISRKVLRKPFLIQR